MNSMRYNLVMYKESEVVDFLMTCLNSKGKNISKIRYAYILHDNDFDDLGELKKPHYHLYVEFPSQVKDRDLFNILQLVGLPSSYLSLEKTNTTFLAYMTHNTKDAKANKTQYQFNNIVSNMLDLQDIYESAVKKANEPSRQEKKLEETKTILTNIFTIIEQNDEIINMASLTKFLLDNGLINELKYVIDKSYAFREILKNLFEFNSKRWAASEIEKERHYAIQDNYRD